MLTPNSNPSPLGSFKRALFFVFLSVGLFILTPPSLHASPISSESGQISYPPTTLTLSYDGKTLVSTSEQGQVDIRHYPDLHLWKTLSFDSKIKAVHFTPDDEALIFIFSDGLLYHHLFSEKQTRLNWPGESPTQISFSSNREFIFVATQGPDGSRLRNLRLKTGEELHTSSPFPQTVLGLWPNFNATEVLIMTPSGETYTWKYLDKSAPTKLDRAELGEITRVFSPFGQPYLILVSPENHIHVLNKTSGEHIKSLKLPYINDHPSLPIQAMAIHPTAQELYIGSPPFIFSWQLKHSAQLNSTDQLYAPNLTLTSLPIDLQHNRLLGDNSGTSIRAWDLDKRKVNEKIGQDIETKWEIWKKKFPLETQSSFQKRRDDYKVQFQGFFFETLKKYWSELSYTLQLTPKSTNKETYQLHSTLFQPITVVGESHQFKTNGTIPITEEWILLACEIAPINPKNRGPYTLKKLTLKDPKGTIWQVSQHPPFDPKEKLSQNRKKKFLEVQQVAKLQDGIETGQYVRHYLFGDGVTKNTDTALKIAKLSSHPLSAFYLEQLKLDHPTDQKKRTKSIRLLNLVTSLKELYLKASHPELALAIGLAYEKGLGVPLSIEDAELWYQKDAHRDPAVAWRWSNLIRGKYRQKNQKKAFELALFAAEEGIPEAAYQVGRDLRSGFGIKQDRELGAKWLGKSAQSGYNPAQLALADALFTGDGVFPSQKSAIQQLSLAKERGSELGLFELFKQFDQLSPANQIDTLTQLVSKQETNPTAALLLGQWIQNHPHHDLKPKQFHPKDRFEKAAQSGIKTAYEPLADLLTHLNHDHEYDPEIIHWYEKASQTSPEANYKLSRIYTEGSIANKNLKTALLYLKSAAKEGHAQANFELSQFYNEHHSLSHAKKHHRKALIRAVEAGHPEARLALAKLVEPEKESLPYITLLLTPLAEKKSPAAQQQLSQVLEHQLDGKPSHQFYANFWRYRAAYSGQPIAQYRFALDHPTLATYFFKAAAKQGDPNAQLKLSELLKETEPIQSTTYLIKAANQQLPEAMTLFSTAIHQGKRLPTNNEWAILTQRAINPIQTTQWDKNEGLAIFFELQAPYLSTPNYNLEIESQLLKGVELIRNGLNRLGKERLSSAIKEHALYLYQRGFWQFVYHHQLPQDFTTTLLQSLPEDQKLTLPYHAVRTHQLILNQQFSEALKAIHEAESLLPTLPLSAPLAPYKGLLSIQKALAQAGKTGLEEALSTLYLNRPFETDNSYLKNYLARWGTVLFKNPQQLAYSLRIKVTELPTPYTPDKPITH